MFEYSKPFHCKRVFVLLFEDFILFDFVLEAFVFIVLLKQLLVESGHLSVNQKSTDHCSCCCHLIRVCNMSSTVLSFVSVVHLILTTTQWERCHDLSPLAQEDGLESYILARVT